jgi:hypothetical protein
MTVHVSVQQMGRQKIVNYTAASTHRISSALNLVIFQVVMPTRMKTAAPCSLVDTASNVNPMFCSMLRATRRYIPDTSHLHALYVFMNAIRMLPTKYLNFATLSMDLFATCI